MITLYDVLGVSPKDDSETLKDAFRNAVKTSHPDLHADDPHAIARFRQVVRANAILSDPDQRAVYDHLLEFQRWQERAKTRRGLVLSTLRNLAADAITVGLLAALMGGGYLVFTHLSKTSVAAVGTTELAAVAEAPARQTEHEGSRLSREELHELITGPGPGPSVVAGATEGGAGALTPATESAITPSAPPQVAKADAMIAAAVPAALGAIEQGAPAPAATEGTGQTRETTDDGSALATPVRAADAKVGDVAVSDGKRAEAQAGEAKVDEAKVDEAKVDEAKVDEAKVDEAKVDEAKVDEAKAGDTKADETKADESKSSDPKFYLARGRASYRNGDLDRALADFDQAILLDPSSKGAYMDRSIVLYRKAEVDRAFADVAQASRIQESLRAATRSHRAAARN